MNTRTFTFGLVLYTCLGCRFLGNQSESNSEVAPPVTQVEPQPFKSASAIEQPGTKTSIGEVTENPPEDDHFSQAADCLEKGDERGALRHFKAHLLAHPDQFIIRLHVAELLVKLGRFPEAQWHFEKFIADAQSGPATWNNKLLHCHARLMEIAQKRNDEYAEHLHRGIGFVLLSRQITADVEEPSPGFCESVLCKAAAELQSAQKARPQEARPYCYLHEVYRKLEQARPAEVARDKAKTLAVFGSLTSTEQQTLFD